MSNVMEVGEKFKGLGHFFGEVDHTYQITAIETYPAGHSYYYANDLTTGFDGGFSHQVIKMIKDYNE
jgi:hypothetical protein